LVDNFTSGQQNSKNVQEKRHSEQINNSTGKAQQQKPTAANQVANNQQARNAGTSSGYGNIASSKFTFANQHLNQPNATSAIQKQKLKHSN